MFWPSPVPWGIAKALLRWIYTPIHSVQPRPKRVKQSPTPCRSNREKGRKNRAVEQKLNIWHFYCWYDKSKKPWNIAVSGLFFGSSSRTWTYDISVNSRTLYRLSYWGIYRPILKRIGHWAGIDLSFQVVSNQVFSTQMSLTSVFGMGTGGSSSPLTPAILFQLKLKRKVKNTKNKRKSPRPISTCWLNMSPCLHLRPINLIVFEGSYLLT